VFGWVFEIICTHTHKLIHTHTCARAHSFSLSNTHTHAHTHIHGQNQQAALTPQNLSAEYTVAPVFEQAPRASSAVMSGLIVPAPRMMMPPQNYTPSLAPSPGNYGRQEQDNWSLDVASSVFANRPGPPAKMTKQPPVSTTSLQSRIVFEGYPS
jgi:hypothetical protein